jgi:uncharacterized membrane protein
VATSEPARGSTRRSLGAWVRGEPLGIPTHALFVHFPAALLPVSAFLDLLAWFGLVLGLLGAIPAVATGLIDWLGMISGTPRWRRVRRHLLVQAAALVGFVVSLVLHAVAPTGDHAPTAAVLLSLVASAVLLTGNHLGGLLVYRDGMRVRSGRAGP